MKKRLFSAALALSLVLSILPAPVFAENSGSVDMVTPSAFEYYRKAGYDSTGVALLNKYTGQSSDFYDSLKNDGAVGSYNAMWYFGRWYSHVVNSGDADTKNNITWTYDLDLGRADRDESKQMYLNELIKVKNNIEVNLSATFTNYYHTHTKKGYTIGLNAYEIVRFNFNDQDVIELSGGDDYGADKTRLGDGEFVYLNYDADSKDNPRITFETGKPMYYVKKEYYTCTCGGAQVENFLLTFRDAKDPQLQTISYSSDGKTWHTSAGAASRFTAGQTVYIKLTYDEPLRFADDDSTGMNELYINLQKDGEGTGSGQKAYLYKLDNTDLYFKYTVNSKELTDSKYPTKEVTTLDLSPLFTAIGSDKGTIPYKPSGGGALSVPGDAASVKAITGDPESSGFTTSTCYITDIAGNPLSSKTLSSANLVLDTEGPTVTEIVFSAATNNADVKAARGKTDPSGEDYADDSDLYLGAGDTLSATVKLSEKLMLELQKNYLNESMTGNYHTLLNWAYATATTNIKVPEGYTPPNNLGVNADGYLTVRSTRLLPYSATGKTSGEVTTITMADIPIVEGMAVDDTNGEIKFTDFTIDLSGIEDQTTTTTISSAITYTSNYYQQLVKAGCKTKNGKLIVSDLSGNVAEDGTLAIEVGANRNPYRLDVTPPTVTAGGYTPLSASDTGSGKGFYYHFSIGKPEGESSASSDLENINGSFVLTNGGDGVAYEFEYAVKAAAGTDIEWKTATIGVSVPFTQTPEVYLYVRAKIGETYRDLRDCQLVVSASDYAGNTTTVTLPEGGALDWYIDTTAPTVTAGNTTRQTQTDGSGTLTASLELSDNHGISTWQYAWGGSDTAAPSSWTDGGGLSENDGDTVTVTTGATTVEKGTLFSRYLWVRATDNSDAKNVTTICLGRYTYDLRAARYGLQYNTGIAKSASVEITSLGSEDALVFLVNNPKYPNTATHVLIAKGSEVRADTNIFALDGWESYSSVTETDGIYTFQSAQTSQVIASIKDGTYAGKLNIRVLSGKAAGIVNKMTIGNESYKFSESSFTLNVTGGAPDENYYYKSLSDGSITNYVTLTGSGMDNVIGGDDWSRWDGETRLLSTLEGQQLTITISQDNYGFLCEDIDYASSKIVLTNTTTNKSWDVTGLRPFVGRQGNSPLATQTVTLPANAYTTGVYKAELQLYFVTDRGESSRKVLTIPYTLDGSQTIEKTIVVDATEPDESFTVSSIDYGVGALYNTYNNDLFAMSSVYEDRQYTVGTGGVIELPVAAGDEFGKATTSGAYGNGYAINITSPGESGAKQVGDISWTGLYYLEMWNASDTAHKVKLWPDSIDQQTITNDSSVTRGWAGMTASDTTRKTNAVGFVVGDTAGTGQIALKANEENTIVLQKTYANGKTCQTTVKIRPVTAYLSGTLAVDSGKNRLVFTPDEATAANAVGAKVYAFVYQSGVDYKKPGDDTAQYELVEMTQHDLGYWTCPLPENGANYRVFTVSASGSPWASSAAYTSERAPEIELATVDGYMDGFKDNGDGTWEMKFYIDDDLGTIYTGSSVDTTRWPDVTIGFGSDYCADSFQIDRADFEKVSNSDVRYQWSAGNNASATGVYEITAEAYDSCSALSADQHSSVLVLTVRGVYLASLANAESKDMGLTVTATDRAGNVGTKTLTANANYKAPAVTAAELTKEGLKLTFNQPIKPTESWAWLESDDKDTVFGVRKGYKTEWTGAFPITAGGTYELTVRTITGSTSVIEQVDLTDAFMKDGKDWSVTIDWSNTALTKDPVYLTGTLKTPASDAAGLLLVQIGETKDTILIPTGTYNGTETQETAANFDINRGRYYSTAYVWSQYNNCATSTHRTVMIEENGEYEVRAYANRYSELVTTPGMSTNSYIFRQTIHVDNIATSAPEAEVIYDVRGAGRTFTYAELETYVGSGRTIIGDIVATYTTARNVTPTGNTGTAFTFTASNSGTSYTFTYVDDMGNEGSAVAKLPAGLTLAEDIVPPKTGDTRPPVVSVGIYTRRYDSYENAESFVAMDTAAATVVSTPFDGLNYPVQGYRLVLDVRDESDCTIAITGENGTAQPEGITRSANVITVGKAATFTVTVTDKADNATCFTVTEDMLQNIDTTPPTAKITTTANSLYEKTITVEVSDKNDAGDDTGDVTWSLPVAAVRDAENKNKYTYKVTDNGTVEFVFYDAAGNRNEAAGSSVTIVGIDTQPPTLTTTWNPPYIEEDYATGEKTAKYNQPTADAVNTNVTAMIDSDKAMYDLTLTLGSDPENPIKLLENGAVTTSNPYTIRNQGNEAAVTIRATVDRITVTYHEGYGGEMEFTATAPNGKRTTTKIDQQWLNIDKTAPQISTDIQYQKREGYTVPYAAKVTLKPQNEDYVTFSNYGAMEDNGKGGTVQHRYTEDDPLTITFARDGTYNVRFADEAGNTTVVPVTITGIDRTAPKLKKETELTVTGAGENQTATITVSMNEAGTITANGQTYKVTANEKKQITFTDNGSYRITATDTAGNEDSIVVIVGSIDKILPSISFEKNTIYVMAGSSADDLEAELQKGYTVWDNMTEADQLTVAFDKTKVDLSQGGTYTVAYTVKDAAGNAFTASRFVRVIDQSTVCVRVDGKLILPDETAVIAPGAHQITLVNAGKEPYTIRARQGILSTGQMKYLSGSSLQFDEDGNFTVNATGYYTLLITTQSRQTIRIRLYVER